MVDYVYMFNTLGPQPTSISDGYRFAARRKGTNAIHASTVMRHMVRQTSASYPEMLGLTTSLADL